MDCPPLTHVKKPVPSPCQTLTCADQECCLPEDKCSQEDTSFPVRGVSGVRTGTEDCQGRVALLTSVARQTEHVKAHSVLQVSSQNRIPLFVKAQHATKMNVVTGGKFAQQTCAESECCDLRGDYMASVRAAQDEDKWMLKDDYDLPMYCQDVSYTLFIDPTIVCYQLVVLLLDVMRLEEFGDHTIVCYQLGVLLLDTIWSRVCS
jgi:hypothetical protein